MAAGAPVIMTDSNGNRDYMKDKVNCLVVKQNDPNDLKEKLQLLFSDKKLQDRLRKNGLKTALALQIISSGRGSLPTIVLGDKPRDKLG